MKAQFKPLLLTAALLSISVGAARKSSSKKKSARLPYGLLVEYNLAELKKSKVDPALQISKVFKLQHRYRSNYQLIDFFVPIKKSQQRNLRELASLCKKIKQNPLTASCEANRNILKKSQLSSSPAKSHRNTNQREALAENTCSVIPGQIPRLGIHSQHSRYFGQEYVGADLAKEYLRIYSSDPIDSDWKNQTFNARVGILDVGFNDDAMPKFQASDNMRDFEGDVVSQRTQERREEKDEQKASIWKSIGLNAAIGIVNALGDSSELTKESVDRDHGTAVANLIAAPAPMGMSEHVQIIHKTGGLKQADTIQFFDKAKEKNVRLVNLSVGPTGLLTDRLDFIGSKSQSTYLQSDKRNIVVQSVGNDFPKPMLPTILEQSENLGLIAVGNMDSAGFIASSSQENAQVLVHAPGDGIQSKMSTEHEHQTFDGTSASAPVVTGAIANLQAIWPLVTREQTRTLLEKTALKTMASFQKPPLNGAGMVNAYKLVRVAENIRKACINSANKEQCASDVIALPQTHRFEAASESKIQSLRDRAIQAFPGCAIELPNEFKSKEANKDFVSCDEKQAITRVYREAVLLSDDDFVNPEAARMLGCIHDEQRFFKNGSFYRSLAWGQYFSQHPPRQIRREILNNNGSQMGPRFYSTLDLNHHYPIAADILARSYNSDKKGQGNTVIQPYELNDLANSMAELDWNSLSTSARESLQESIKIGAQLRGRRSEKFKEIAAARGIQIPSPTE